MKHRVSVHRGEIVKAALCADTNEIRYTSATYGTIAFDSTEALCAMLNGDHYFEPEDEEVVFRFKGNVDPESPEIRHRINPSLRVE